jgi:hypothetical protein
MGVQEIEQAVTRLSQQELVLFRRWFEAFDNQAWDKQIEADAKSGKLDAIADKALTEYRAGKAKEI